MALSAAECRKNRGTAKGTLTRTSNQVYSLLKAEVVTLESTAITKMRDSVDKAEELFIAHHDLLFHEHAQMDAETYLREADESQSQVMEAKSQLTQLTAKLSAAQTLRRVETSLDRLELNSDEGFQPEMLDDFPVAKDLYMKFEEASSHISLASNASFDKARRSLTTRLAAINKLRRPLLPVVDAPAASSLPPPVHL